MRVVSQYTPSHILLKLHTPLFQRRSLLPPPSFLCHVPCHASRVLCVCMHTVGVWPFVTLERRLTVSCFLFIVHLLTLSSSIHLFSPSFLMPLLFFVDRLGQAFPSQSNEPLIPPMNVFPVLLSCLQESWYVSPVLQDRREDFEESPQAILHRTHFRSSR